jgi:hypothetical protein
MNPKMQTETETDTDTTSLSVIGIDIDKEVFHLVGFSDGKIAVRKKIKRLAFKDTRRAAFTITRQP